MATYTISQITLPNGDVCILKDPNAVTAEIATLTELQTYFSISN